MDAINVQIEAYSLKGTSFLSVQDALEFFFLDQSGFGVLSKRSVHFGFHYCSSFQWQLMERFSWQISISQLTEGGLLQVFWQE